MLPSGGVDRIDLAHTIAHELAHTRGMTHREMLRDPAYTRTGNWREIYSWAETLPLEKQQPKAKPTLDHKISHVQAMLAKAETRERRAKTIRQKWEKKLRYLERKNLPLAAMRPEKGGAA